MKKTKYTLTTCYLLLTTFLVNAQDATEIKAYIEKYKDIAIKEMNRVGIPASITLAQGLHESGFGNSFLAKNTNNHFGIKCHETWTGKTFSYTDDAPDECFRVYDKVEESYIDHSEFLKNRPRYSALFLFAKTDYKAWSYGLKKAGYATNPKYPEIIIKLIEENELYRFDKSSEELATDNIKDAEENSIDISEIKFTKEDDVEKKKTNEDGIDKTIKTPAFINKSVPKKVTKINKCDAVRIAKNETLDIIAEKVKIDKQDLISFNDISTTTELKESQYLFIEKKKKKNKEKKYTVKSKDNMWLIAQKKGVQLTALLKRNKLKVGEEPAIKEIIYLSGRTKKTPALRPAENTEKSAIIVKAQSPIETSISSKEIIDNTAILRTNDTIYPSIKEAIKNSRDSNKILSFESDTKLLENNYSVQTPINADNDTIVKTPTPPIQTKSNPDFGRSVSVYERGLETPTIYPATIDYNKLPKSTTGLHTVIKGDTMYNICKRYNISIAQIMEWNHLSEQSVKLGQILKVQP